MARFSIEDRRTVVGIDLGTSSIKCAIGVLSPDGIEVAGASQIPHKGLHKGRIVNMKETSEAVQEACKEAEAVAGLQTAQLFLGIGGEYRVFSSQGMSVISSQQVTSDDVNKAVETAKAVPMRTGHRLLHVLPKNFTVDQEGPFFNPLGLSGLRLETAVLMVSLPESSVQNALQCLRYAGYSARGLVLQPLALTLSVLNDDEKQSGVCVVNIGQDHTCFTVVLDSRVHQIGSIPIGGEDFTHDLMLDLKISWDIAESIKLKYGNILFHEDWEDEEVILEECREWNIQVTHKKVNQILKSRSELLFHEIRNQLESFRCFNRIEGGVILTGRGSSLRGLVETGRSILEKPVKKGIVQNCSGVKDMDNRNDFATALGILSYAYHEKSMDYRSEHWEGRIFKIRRWVQDLLP